LKLARSQRLPYDEMSFLRFKSYLLRLRGDFPNAYDAATRAMQKAIEVRYGEGEVEALHLTGLCEVSLGRIVEAHKTAMTMEQRIEKMGYSKLMRHRDHLEGMIAVSRNSRDEAVKFLSKAVEILPQQNLLYDPLGLYLESLASAFFQRGDLDSAREEYEKVISLTTGFLTAGDAYARSLYQLGRICQKKNEVEKAKEYFQKFLNVLHDADPDLPEVEDARKRLASLS